MGWGLSPFPSSAILGLFVLFPAPPISTGGGRLAGVSSLLPWGCVPTLGSLLCPLLGARQLTQQRGGTFMLVLKLLFPRSPTHINHTPLFPGGAASGVPPPRLLPRRDAHAGLAGVWLKGTQVVSQENTEERSHPSSPASSGAEQGFRFFAAVPRGAFLRAGKTQA